MQNIRGVYTKKAAAFLAAMLLLSSCGQTDNADISETLLVSETSEITETSVNTEQETEAASQTTAETTSETEPEVLLTPLEQVYKYCEGKNNCLMYDFTGDNFPEVLEIFPDGMRGFEYAVIDAVDEREIGFGVVGDDNKLYVCQDDDHKYIVSEYVWDMAHFWRWEAECNDFLDNGVSRRKIGYLESYHKTDNENNDRFYNFETSFEGSDREPSGFFSTDTEETIKLTDEIFAERFNEYLSKCNVIEEIRLTVDENDCLSIRSTLETADFTESPADDYRSMIDFYGSADKTEYNSFTRGAHYRYDGVYVSDNGEFMVLYLDDIPDDFDFTSLKEFENVRKLHIQGRADNLEFVKTMPEIMVIELQNFRLTEVDKEILRPLLELPNLAAIADSGMGSFIDDFPKDEAGGITNEMFKGYHWVFIK